MLNLILAGIALLAIIFFLVTSNTDERISLIIGAWLGLFMTVQLMIGLVKITTEGERDYNREAEALITECEKSLPRDQNCVIEMKAVAQ